MVFVHAFGYALFALFIIGVSTGRLAKIINNLITIAGKGKENERNQVSQRIEKVEETD